MDEVFEKYYARIRKEAVLKSIIFAFAAALIAVAVAGLIFWFVGFWQVWLLAVIAVGAFVAATPALYFLIFRPTKREAAKRMDSQLGLEERMLTMVELEYSNSPIAYLQKQNTVSALAGTTTKALTFAATAAVAIVLPVAVAVGAAGATFSALGASGIIPSGVSLIASASEGAPTEYTVKYLIDEGGVLVGEGEQKIVRGGNASAVIAVPHLDETHGQWVFIGWSDGVNTPARTDKNIEQNKTVTAHFAPMDGLPDIEDEEDPRDADSALYDPDGEGDQGGSGGEPNGPKEPSEEGEENGDETEGDGSGGVGGGKDSDFNQVIDGNTYYGGTTFQDAYEQASQELSEGGEVPDELKDGIEKYYETIKK